LPHPAPADPVEVEVQHHLPYVLLNLDHLSPPGQREGPYERVLDQVLGLGAVAAQEVGIPLQRRTAKVDEGGEYFLPAGQRRYLLDRVCWS
jgi:hypothetical protein